MPKITFRYSPVYDQTLGQLEGQPFTRAQYLEGERFEKSVARLWKPYNNKFFRYIKSIGLYFPEEWFVYVVHNRARLDPFSDPLTIFISKDKEDTIATIAHELSHVILQFEKNERKMDGIWRHISRTFKGVPWDHQVHIAVAILTRAAMRNMMGVKKAEQILIPERRFYGLKKAWRVVDLQGWLDWDHPLEAMENLRKVKL